VFQKEVFVVIECSLQDMISLIVALNKDSFRLMLETVYSRVG
jgi:hypothetical protein